MKAISIPLLGAFILFFHTSYSQNFSPPQINTPVPASIGNNSGFNSYQNPVPVNSKNERQIKEYEQDVKEYERRKKQQEELAKEAIDESNASGKVYYKLPFDPNRQGLNTYAKTYDYLYNVMIGKQPLSLKDAVFLSEKAYDPRLSYEWYDKEIKRMTNLCQLILQESKHSPKSNLAKLMAIYRFMSDTVKFKTSFPEGKLVTYPMLYDFEDNYGRKDLHKQFITKLIEHHTGQCHSMPLLFLILCEQMKAEAYLVHAPEHTFIKFQDNKKRKWFNLELTSGRFSTDAFTINTGYVKAGQIASGIYLDTMSARETIADVMVDLAGGYERKYGADGFMEMMADTIIKYYPKNTRALATKSVYYNALVDYVARQLHYPRDKASFPTEFAGILDQRNAFYKYMNEINYEEISKEAYDQFQRMLESGKQLREHQGQYVIIKSSMSKK